MKKTDDSKKTDMYVKKYGLDFLKIYPLHLYAFATHELINEKLNPRRFLLFLVSGTVRIYSPRSNGSLNQITRSEAPCCLGDMEFTNPDMKQFLIETVTPCEFVCLDIIMNRSQIENDPKMLLFLLHSVSHKTIEMTQIQAETTDIESRVLYYLERESSNHEIRGVSQLSQHLNCSRRQLQRVLKKMQEEKIIIKKNRGIYVKTR